MNYTVVNEEVLYSTESVTRLNQTDIDLLKGLASKNQRKRIRLCLHPNTEDHLHEMIIIHSRGAYVRPHKHVGKSESFHVVEGRLRVYFFEDDGQVKDIITMGQPGWSEIFYYRLSGSWFHTLVPISEMVVFHETTNGPFIKERTVFAPWAPREDDYVAQKSYLEKLLMQRSPRPLIGKRGKNH